MRMDSKSDGGMSLQPGQVAQIQGTARRMRNVAVLYTVSCHWHPTAWECAYWRLSIGLTQAETYTGESSTAIEG
jgi:hypothetical protein